MIPERRRLKRFSIRKGKYFYIFHDFRKLGALVEISIKGMSYKYIKGQKGYGRLNEVIEVEICDRTGDSYLKGIPFTPTYDVPHTSPHSWKSRSLSSFFMRRVGGDFDGISSDKRKQLRRFIMTFGL